MWSLFFPLLHRHALFFTGRESLAISYFHILEYHQSLMCFSFSGCNAFFLCIPFMITDTNVPHPNDSLFTQDFVGNSELKWKNGEKQLG